MPWWNPWSREPTDLLAKYWPEGWSFRELAIRINNECGTCFTRSAVAGKVARMHLSTVERMSRAPRARPPRAPRQLSAAATKPAPVARKPLPCEPRMIDILDLRADTCRFPYGDFPPFRYCGCPILKGSPYCRDHTVICWNHPPLDLGA